MTAAPTVGAMVRVLPPQSKNSPPDGWTGSVLRVSSVSEALRDAELSDEDGRPLVYITFARLEVL
jgi:hypothetical protein